MIKQLDYETPIRQSRATLIWLAAAVGVSLAAHLLIYRLFCVPSGEEVRLNKCFEISIGYWVIVALIVGKRRLRLTPVDLILIASGYPAAVLACALGTEI